MTNEPLKDFVLDGSNHSVQDIVSKLRFIAKIKESEKLDVSNLQLFEDTWWNWNKAYRALFSRKGLRQATLEFIRLVFAEAFDLASKHINTHDHFRIEIGKMILEAMKEAKMGIDSLGKTYATDRMFTSQLETLVKIFDTKITELSAISAKEKKASSAAATSTTSVSFASVVKPSPASRLLLEDEDEQQ